MKRTLIAAAFFFVSFSAHSQGGAESMRLPGGNYLVIEESSDQCNGGPQAVLMDSDWKHGIDATCKTQVTDDGVYTHFDSYGKTVFWKKEQFTPLKQPASTKAVSKEGWFIVDTDHAQCMEAEPQTKWMAGRAGIDTPEKYYAELRADHIPAVIKHADNGLVLVANFDNHLWLTFANGRSKCEEALKTLRG